MISKGDVDSTLGLDIAFSSKLSVVSFRETRSFLWGHRVFGILDLNDRVHEQKSVKGKAKRNGRAKARNPEIKPVHRSEPSAGAHDQPHGIRVHCGDPAAEALTHKKQAKPQSEENISRPDDPKILSANPRHLGILAEQA